MAPPKPRSPYRASLRAGAGVNSVGIFMIALLQQKGLSATQWQPTRGTQTCAQQPACDKAFFTSLEGGFDAVTLLVVSELRDGSFTGIFIATSFAGFQTVVRVTTRSTSPAHRSS